MTNCVLITGLISGLEHHSMQSLSVSALFEFYGPKQQVICNLSVKMQLSVDGKCRSEWRIILQTSLKISHPPCPCYGSRVTKSTCNQLKDNPISRKKNSIAQIRFLQILVLSVFCLFHSYIKFADTTVTKVTDVVNHRASQSTQGGQPSPRITSALV